MHGHYCTGEWSTPDITGQPPQPTDECTLTPVDKKRAALFGGRSGSKDVSDELLIVELSRNTVVSEYSTSHACMCTR